MKEKVRQNLRLWRREIIENITRYGIIRIQVQLSAGGIFGAKVQRLN
jgi:hypothetical protein